MFKLERSFPEEVLLRLALLEVLRVNNAKIIQNNQVEQVWTWVACWPLRNKNILLKMQGHAWLNPNQRNDFFQGCKNTKHWKQSLQNFQQDQTFTCTNNQFLLPQNLINNSVSFFFPFTYSWCALPNTNAIWQDYYGEICGIFQRPQILVQ